ncbi:xylose isomerase-like protein [Melampsora americana]|nr:xylose isomerase-like protein [Melampsora americana]
MFSTFSHSLGDHSVHELTSKLIAAAQVGLEAVEISTIDLDHHALQPQHLSQPSPLLSAATEIGKLCVDLNLIVTCLQPVRDVIEVKPSAAQAAKQRVISLFPIMDALHTNLLLCCSSSLPEIELDSSIETSIENLRQIGLEAKLHSKSIAFEALSWGTLINTWSQVWKIVKSVDLPNVGICLDSFNTLAREWADPTVQGGIQPGANERLAQSLIQLSDLPCEKIFLLQIADGSQLSKPIPKEGEQPALMRWSRSSRLFPMESGGYLPLEAFIMAVTLTGYQGIWSTEIFNTTLFEKDHQIPISHALRAKEGLEKLYHQIFHHSDLDQSNSIQFNQFSSSSSDQPGSGKLLLPSNLVFHRLISLLSLT